MEFISKRTCPVTQQPDISMIFDAIRKLKKKVPIKYRFEATEEEKTGDEPLFHILDGKEFPVDFIPYGIQSSLPELFDADDLGKHWIVLGYRQFEHPNRRSFVRLDLAPEGSFITFNPELGPH